MNEVRVIASADSAPAGEIYLPIDRRELIETTDDRRRAQLIADWLS